MTAIGAGGVAPYQFKYVMRVDGGIAETMRDWSTNPAWAIQALSASTIAFEVWGRSAGATTNSPEVSTTFTLTATEPPVNGPVTGTSVSSDVGSPRPVGQSVTFWPVPVGGVRPYQTKWFVDGAVAQNWTETIYFTWIPAAPGAHSITLWIRSAGATADAAEASSTFSFTAVSAAAPYMTGITWGTKTETRVGTTIQATLPFSGVGGTAPYEFRVQYREAGGNYRVISDWSRSTSVTWTITTTGQQSLLVSGRSAGSTNPAGEVTSGYYFWAAP